MKKKELKQIIKKQNQAINNQSVLIEEILKLIHKREAIETKEAEKRKEIEKVEKIHRKLRAGLYQRQNGLDIEERLKKENKNHERD